MRIVAENRFRTGRLIISVAIPLLFVLFARISAAQEGVTPLPEVIKADMPVYPPIARAAHVYGVVHLHLATDGKRVSAITEQTGPAMLIPAAEAYVRTWEFAEHNPTAFDASFRYQYESKSECETGIKLDPAILHLPTEVEVIAAPYCDSVRFFRNKKILAEQHAYAVELHFVINGHEVENPSEVVVTIRINKNTFHSVTLPVKDGLLLVPEEMVKGSDLTFRARIGQDQIDVSGISPSPLVESWRIIFADKRHGDGYEFAVPKGWNVRSSCLIECEPLEGDGMTTAVSSCRKPVNK